MPCFVTGTAKGDAEMYERIAVEEAQKATRAACEMARLIRRFRLVNHLSGETRDWIKAHRTTDKK